MVSGLWLITVASPLLAYFASDNSTYKFALTRDIKVVMMTQFHTAYCALFSPTPFIFGPELSDRVT